MEELVAHCRTQKWELIMACDTNSHHVSWGSEDNNTRGKSLYDYININNLCISNRGCVPTFVNSRSQTLIDVTLTMTRISNVIQNWHVADTASMSEHRWINFNINLIKTPQKPFRDPRGTDRNKYLCHLRENLAAVQDQEPRNNGEIEVFVNTVQSVIKRAFITSCPLRSARQTGAITGWWNRELSELRKKARISFNKAKMTRQDSDWEIYKPT
ncbi:uncharacterized protein LOC108914833 [Anoplophora glabripennis]|uniref:uncharacterized protein LOC108914833 n=1 Tax=Anoplophora glabripennis TaxID=217634 RepID=UPI0008745535|nr:uncharacterized protein LOC108914833 [Anoplophora glabripennis]